MITEIVLNPLMNTTIHQFKYTLRCKPRELFKALYRPVLLENWIADEVRFDEETQEYTFFWGDFSEKAILLVRDERKKIIQWKWLGRDNKAHEYVRISLSKPDTEGYVDIYIEDFCEEGQELSLKQEWDRNLQYLEEMFP